MTLKELTDQAGRLLNHPSLQNVWVVAELQDVSDRGHCYMELVEKDENGTQLARVRGMIWQYVYQSISARFFSATGRRIESGIKVMLKGSVTMHPVFGMGFNITDINPEYTLGDLVARRNALIIRLKQEGIYDMNRSVPCPMAPQRIAIISSASAAGYGDFMNQLHHNPCGIGFLTELFEASMQGVKAPASIINALDRVAQRQGEFDVVVIIRGGGATADLQAYEDYDLASNVAQFPLPVIVGIGHERDITILDYVAQNRQKTPTAVAEWLVKSGEGMLAYLQGATAAIVQITASRIATCREQLQRAVSLVVKSTAQRMSDCREYISKASTTLDTLPLGIVERERTSLTHAAQSLTLLSTQKIMPALTVLDGYPEKLLTAWANILTRRRDFLASQEHLLEVLSPQATLLRGYSITRVNGHAVSDPSAVAVGTLLETTLAKGTITSRVQ